MRAFQIFDPKPRLIHAPVFRDRVLHHALIAHIGPVLERSLVFDTYACRVGKGTIAAVSRVQHFARRFPWCAQIDIRSYFPNIEHGILSGLLERRFKEWPAAALHQRHDRRPRHGSGQGPAIGALTSQHFANLYLDGCDRFLLESLKARGMVRYMDDTVWWADSKEAVRSQLGAVAGFLRSERGLEIKQLARIGRSADGISYCGFRVLPGAILLSRRRRRRYAETRARWELAFEEGRTDAGGLQAGYASALGMTHRERFQSHGARSNYGGFRLAAPPLPSKVASGVRAGKKAPRARCAAAPGTTTPGTRGRRTATGTNARTGTTTSGSAAFQLTGGWMCAGEQARIPATPQCFAHRRGKTRWPPACCQDRWMPVRTLAGRPAFSFPAAAAWRGRSGASLPGEVSERSA